MFSVDSNHTAICKIPSAESQEYEAVGFWIVKLVKMAVESTKSADIQCRLRTYHPVVSKLMPNSFATATALVLAGAE